MEYRILRSIIALEGMGLQVSAANIKRDCGCSVTRLLRKLEDDGLVYLSGIAYVVTDEGQQALEASVLHPYYSDDTAFRDQVLWPTATDDQGQQKCFDGNPVLPSGSKPHTVNPDYAMVSLLDEVFMIKESIELVMSRYGYDLDRTMKLHDDGRIGICDECGEVGVFRRISHSGNLRGRCTICEGVAKAV